MTAPRGLPFRCRQATIDGTTARARSNRPDSDFRAKTAFMSEMSDRNNTRIDPDVAWAKLASLAQGAELASQRLWS